MKKNDAIDGGTKNVAMKGNAVHLFHYNLVWKCPTHMIGTHLLWRPLYMLIVPSVITV